MLKVAKEEEKYIVSLFQVNKLNTLFSELISSQLNNLVSRPDRHVIFNLKGVKFIDTAGFHTLSRANHLSKFHGSIFQLSNLSDDVMELLTKTDVRNTFDIIPHLEVKEKIVMELDEI